MKELKFYYCLEESFYYLVLQEVISGFSKDFQEIVFSHYETSQAFTFDSFTFTDILNDDSIIISIGFLNYLLFSCMEHCPKKEKENLTNLIKQLNMSLKPIFYNNGISFPIEMSN